MHWISFSKGLTLFLLGFFTSFLVAHLVTVSSEFPSSPSLTGAVVSPYDTISEDNILVYPDRVVIKVSGATISRYAPTKSMSPVLDKGANGIRIKPVSAEDIHVGDIITYQSKDGLIVHRVIEIGTDEAGIYFIAKGDNSNAPDPYHIRPADVLYKTIALVY